MTLDLAELRLKAETRASRALLKLPRPWLVRLSGGKRVVVDAEPLDEQVQLLMFLSRVTMRKRNEELGLLGARAAIERDARVLDVAPREMARVEDRRVATKDGGSFGVRVYVPPRLEGTSKSPGLLYLHGGGFVIGSLESHDSVCRYLADETPCVVVSADYRLAPEHKFPVPVEDAVTAFEWTREHADELGIDLAKIAVGGDSAGGNLSAVICQEAKRAGKPLPAFQLLVYPATDFSRKMASHRLFRKGFFLEKPTIDWFLDQYLRTPADIDDVRTSCLFASEKDLAGLPPALVLTAGFDPLRDEGTAYAEKLAAAGVKVEHRNDAGMFHGYFSCGGGIDVAKDALDHAARALRTALGS